MYDAVFLLVIIVSAKELSRLSVLAFAIEVFVVMARDGLAWARTDPIREQNE